MTSGPGEVAGAAGEAAAGTGASRRLHPATPVLDLAVGARGAVLPFGALVIAYGPGVLVVAAVLLAVVLGTQIARWARFTYRFDGDVLRVEEGVLARRVRSVPVERVHQVEVRARLRHRLVGVVELRLETASGSGGEVTLSVLGRSEAERLRQVLAPTGAATGVGTGTGARPAADGAGASTGTGTATGGDGATSAAPPAPGSGTDAVAAGGTVPEERRLVAIGSGQLAVAGMTGARLAVVAAALGVVARVLDELPRSMTERLVDALPRGTGAVVVAAILAGPLWLGLAALSAIVSDHGFTLDAVGGDLRVRRGLLDRRETTLVRHRIQVVRIHQSPIRRLLGVAAVQLQGAGTQAGGDDDIERVTVPLVRAGRLDPLIAELAPGLDRIPALVPAPPAARRRAIRRRAAVAALIVAGPVAGVAAGFGSPTAAAILLAVTLAAGAAAGELAYRGLGHALAGRHLVTRRGGLFRETVVVPVAKTQSARLRRSVFQRRVGLATLLVDVAGRGRTPAVPEVAAGRLATLQRAVLGAPAARADEARVRRQLDRSALAGATG